MPSRQSLDVGDKMNTYALIALAVTMTAATLMAQPPATVADINALFADIQKATCPTNGMTEAEVSAKWGPPRGATTPLVEKQNGNYDKDGLGLYRWFYDTRLSWKEPETGLAVGNNVEMIVYFIDGKVVASHLKFRAPLSGQTFLAPDGITHTFSGQPPVLRKTHDGATVWDFHVDEGQYDYHRRLITTLNAYREYWITKWNNESGSELSAGRSEEEKNRQDVDRLQRETLADLKSPDAGKRLSAVNCLSQWPINEAIKDAVMTGLLDALDDPDPGVRRRASWGLGQRGVKGITDRILKLIERDPEGAFQYIDALGLQGAPEGLPTLIQYASSTNEHWRKGAVYALRHFTNDAARTTLEASLSDPYWEVKCNAIQSLEELGRADSAQRIAPLLHDDNSLIVRTAVRAVAKLDADGSATNLLGMLESPDKDIRQAACYALAQVTPSSTGPIMDALIRSMDDSSQEVRMAAIVALARIGTKESVAALSERSASSTPEERAYINRAIEMLQTRQSP